MATPLGSNWQRSDQHLIQQFLQNEDQNALYTLVKRHHGLIQTLQSSFKRNGNAEDFLHDVYLIVFERLPKVGMVKNFPAWLRMVVVNHLRDQFRRQAVVNKYENWQKLQPSSYRQDIDKTLDEEKLSDYAFAQVKDAEADCLYRQYMEGLSYQEIAEELDLSYKQVCGRIDRGMERMRKGFGQVKPRKKSA